MCGISGYWAYASSDLPADVFRRVNDRLAHRGPDGHGVEHFPQDRLWLGHRRLSIIDVSERGRQPMSYADGRYWLTYNGEIYNFLELRKTLSGLGHRFLSDTDSEVILAAYAHWGPACQLKFNGMWAFAIWDRDGKTLFLSRDRFGIKPLHYRAAGGSLAFASELKSFLSLPGVDGAFDAEILAETLSNINGQESTAHTLLPGVKRLPGGHSLTISRDGSVQLARWWDTLSQVPACAAQFDRQADEFRELFVDSCRLRLRSDVPIATALSGGLDSSAIACTLAALQKGGTVEHAPDEWHRAFVACFPGTRLDERRYAQQIVEHTGMAAQYEDIDDSRTLDVLDQVIFDLEGIYWVPLVGPWAIYQAMRKGGIRVSLDGHGADELLGGYHFHVERALDAVLQGRFSLRRYLELKRVLRGFAGGSADSDRGSLLGDLQAVARRELKRLGMLERTRHVTWRLTAIRQRVLGALARPEGAQDSMPAALAAAEPALLPYSGPKRLYDEEADPRTAGMRPFSRMLFTWFHGSVLPTILRSYDRASMAHGIEVRMPFMDWRLVTYGFALPEESKLGRGYTKRILRQAMTGLMPDPIRLRTNKIGFTSPLDEWTRGKLRPWVGDLASSRSFLESPVWNGRAVRAAVDRALAAKASINPVWPILNAHSLQNGFMRAAQAEGPVLAPAIGSL